MFAIFAIEAWGDVFAVVLIAPTFNSAVWEADWRFPGSAA